MPAGLDDYKTSGMQPFANVVGSNTLSFTLAASTTIAAPYNPQRRYLLVVNGSGNTGYLGIGETAGSGIGIPILPFGSYEMTQGTGNVDPGVITIYGTGTFYVREGT